MKREDLQKIDGLTKEQIDSIMNLHQTDVTTWTTKLNNKDAELTTEKGKVTSLTNDLAKFEGVDVEELKNEKATFETEKAKMIADHEKELNDVKFESALDLAIYNTNTVDPIAFKAHLDRSKLTYNEETKTVDGFDDQAKAVRAERAYLFSQGAGGRAQGGFGGNDDNSNLSLSGALTEHYTKE